MPRWLVVILAVVGLGAIAMAIGRGVIIGLMANAWAPTQTETVAYRETLTFSSDHETLSFDRVHVLELSFRLTPGRGPEVLTRLYGEATPVPLSTDLTIFALIRYPYGVDGQQRTLLEASCGLSPLGEIATAEELKQWVSKAKSLESPCMSPPSATPLFVRFAALEDPLSMARVRPEELPALTEGSVAFLGSSIQVTTDIPTSGQLAGYLPWVHGGWPEQPVEIEADQNARNLSISVDASYFLGETRR